MARVYAAWFERSDWKEIKRLCADDLQDTFDEWLSDAQAGVKGVAAQGFLVEKIILTPDDIRQRQSATGRKVNASDRAQLATAKGLEADNRGTQH